MAKDKQVYRLKVTLRHTKPPIWRRIKVYGNITLYQLHHILQVSMGWTNSHLHMFGQKGVFYGEPDPEFDSECEDESKTRLHDVLRNVKDKMMYEYDFGDSWEHEVVLEAIEEPDPKVDYPAIVAGKRACPPEDVGGIFGYYDFLEAIANPDHPDHDDMVEWYGEAFDPEAFDMESVKQLLDPKGKKNKTKAKA